MVEIKGIYPPVEEFSDFREMLINSREKWGSKTAMMEKVEGEWRKTTYNELFYQVMSLGCGLRKRGMKSKSLVAIASENRIRWGVAYLAVVCGNGTTVPIDRDLKSQEFFHILFTTETEIFIGSQKYVDMVVDIAENLPHLKHIINMDDNDEEASVLSYSKVLDDGSRLFEKDASDYPFTKIDPEDTCAILFTSGTTGTSKGVMLSQTNIARDIQAAMSIIPLRNPETFLSVLPIHHTFECTGGFLLPLSHGMIIAYAENLKRIPDNLLEVQASIMLGVPLLFEAIYKKIMHRIEEKGVLKFKIGKGLSTFSEKFLRKNIRRKVFKPLHEKFGG